MDPQPLQVGPHRSEGSCSSVVGQASCHDRGRFPGARHRATIGTCPRGPGIVQVRRRPVHEVDVLCWCLDVRGHLVCEMRNKKEGLNCAIPNKFHPGVMELTDGERLDCKEYISLYNAYFADKYDDDPLDAFKITEYLCRASSQRSMLRRRWDALPRAVKADGKLPLPEPPASPTRRRSGGTR